MRLRNCIRKCGRTHSYYFLMRIFNYKAYSGATIVFTDHLSERLGGEAFECPGVAISQLGTMATTVIPFAVSVRPQETEPPSCPSLP